MTDDLVAFLRARLDEDEQTAQAVPGWANGWRRNTYPEVVPQCDEIRTAEGALIVEIRDDTAGEHIARWDPARVLAEVEAKRRIVDAFEAVDGDRARLHNAALHLQWNVLRTVVQTLALPHAGHPDYREAWKPWPRRPGTTSR
jgi:hypothetical protein